MYKAAGPSTTGLQHCNPQHRYCCSASPFGNGYGFVCSSERCSKDASAIPANSQTAEAMSVTSSSGPLADLITEAQTRSKQAKSQSQRRSVETQTANDRAKAKYQTAGRRTASPVKGGTPRSPSPKQEKLVGHPWLIYKLPWQGRGFANVLDVLDHTDFAWCREHRRHTSGWSGFNRQTPPQTLEQHPDIDCMVLRQNLRESSLFLVIWDSLSRSGCIPTLQRRLGSHADGAWTRAGT